MNNDTKNIITLTVKALAVGAVILGTIYGTIAIVESMETNSLAAKTKVANAQQEWKDRFPGAYKKRPYTH